MCRSTNGAAQNTVVVMVVASRVPFDQWVFNAVTE